MRNSGTRVLCCFVFFGFWVTCIDGQFLCFRKFRKEKQTCGGLLRKKGIDTAEQCCGWKGQGFSIETLDKIGKNKYRCVSCTDWERQKNELGTIPTEITTPDFVCFRKFRTKGEQCGGPKTKPSTSSPESCCQQYNYGGFSQNGLVGWSIVKKGTIQQMQNKEGKNKYTCTSCVAWQKEKNKVTPETTTLGREEWGVWSECQTTCGRGLKVRYSKCDSCSQSYKPKVEYQPCVINYYCPVDGHWGQWETWKPCSVSCNGGIRLRDRRCDSPAPRHGGKDCDGSAQEKEPCNEQQCAVDGNWGQWSRFGRCSQTCGWGTMTRTRECNRPTPSGGGKLCRGSSINMRRCEHRKCPVHGGWSAWGPWSECPVTCGTGSITRTRECNRPKPFFGGRPCAGSDTETTVCTSGSPCPIHGGWSEWTSYGRCRATKPCSHGHRLRSRVCNNPRPQHRGRLCQGKRVEREKCFDQETCPVDGGWCEYKEWSRCSATCIGFSSTQTRFRACQCPPTKNGGKHCSGDHIETRTCEGTQTCEEISVSIEDGR